METVAVIGSESAIGKAVVDALITRNINTKILVNNVKGFTSHYPSGSPPGEVHAIEGNLDNNQAIAKTLEYSDTIFFCPHLPLNSWKSKLIPWIQKVADLAATLQARLIYPGNIMNFGIIDNNEPINEEFPQNAQTELGQLSVAIENRLTRAAMEGATLTIVRFPLIYGPAMLNDDILYKLFHSAINHQPTDWSGNPNLKHDFLYSQDAGEALVKAALEPRAADALFHFSGPYPFKFDDFIGMVYNQVASSMEPPFIHSSSLKSKIQSMFSKPVSEIKTILERNPIILDDTRYLQIIGPLEKTSHEIGIQKTATWISRISNS